MLKAVRAGREALRRLAEGACDVAEWYVGKLDELDERKARLVRAGDVTVGVFRIGGDLHAWQNNCAHAGGPVCQGDVLGRFEYVLGPDQTVVGERFSDSQPVLTCPWHGWEYDVQTGVCTTDARFRLRRYETVVREGGVYVVA